MGNCLNTPKSLESSCYGDEQQESVPKPSAKYAGGAASGIQGGSKSPRRATKRCDKTQPSKHDDWHHKVSAPSNSNKQVSSVNTSKRGRQRRETDDNETNCNVDACRRTRLTERNTSSPAVAKCSRDHKATQQTYFVALFDYEPRTTCDLALRKGDLLLVLRQTNPSWCYAEMVHERCAGYVPFNHLAPFGSLQCEAWYAGGCRRTDAERRLAMAPLGTFVIRESETRPGEYALSVRDALGVKHYRVRRCAIGADEQNQSAIDGEYAYFVTRRARFTTLQQLVAHYQHDADGLSVQLLATSSFQHHGPSPGPGPGPLQWRCATTTTSSVLCTEGVTVTESETYSERHVPAWINLGPGAPVFELEREAPPIDGLSYDTCDSWEIPKASIELRRKIGAGQFGEVYEAVWNCRTPVAVKTLKLTGAASQQGVTLKRDFLAEAQILKRLRHPKLIQLYAVCTQDEPFFIVTELMQHGSLLEYLKGDAGRTLALPDMVSIGTQIASGMAYLEARQFVHRDLAARNILVGDRLQVKIADFGLARLVTHADSTTASNSIEAEAEAAEAARDGLVYSPKEDAKFPIKWTAPEAALCRRFSTKSDVWSFGVLLFELVSRGRVPYAGMTNAQVLSEITERGYRMAAPPGCPPKFYELMLDCWHAEPHRRPTFETLQWQMEEYFLDDTLDVTYNDCSGSV